MYKILNSNNETPAGKIAWNKICNFSEEEWKKKYKWPFEITNNTTLQRFYTTVNASPLKLHSVSSINLYGASYYHDIFRNRLRIRLSPNKSPILLKYNDPYKKKQYIP